MNYLRPDDPRAPKYWLYETGDQLKPAIIRYLKGETLEVKDILVIRVYLRQWISAPVWSPTIALTKLKARIATLETRHDIDVWLEDAMKEGIDPL
jgi:hypothetical protein